MVKNENILSRFITTKTGTYVLWYDPVARKHRRFNLSKLVCHSHCCYEKYNAGLRR